MELTKKQQLRKAFTIILNEKVDLKPIIIEEIVLDLLYEVSIRFYIKGE